MRMYLLAESTLTASSRKSTDLCCGASSSAMSLVFEKSSLSCANEPEWKLNRL